MPFIIEENSLTIKGRKGDSGIFVFEFETEMDLKGACVHFFVKKNINDLDKNAMIKKEFTDLQTGSITVNLTSVDTSKLFVPNFSYGEYIWGLKIHKGIEFAQTLIPSEFDSAPKMIIYPQIVGEI